MAKTGRPKGYPKTGGRQKGTPNKNTSLLKQAILDAATEVGLDGKGKEGLTGYCKLLAKEHPSSFSGLLGKVLPTQVAGDPDNPVLPQAAIIAALGRKHGEE